MYDDRRRSARGAVRCSFERPRSPSSNSRGAFSPCERLRSPSSNPRGALSPFERLRSPSSNPRGALSPFERPRSPSSNPRGSLSAFERPRSPSSNLRGALSPLPPVCIHSNLRGVSRTRSCLRRSDLSETLFVLLTCCRPSPSSQSCATVVEARSDFQTQNNINNINMVYFKYHDFPREETLSLMQDANSVDGTHLRSFPPVTGPFAKINPRIEPSRPEKLVQGAS
ncbi:pectinesterase inhibitor 10-like [Spinacia oleracea]|uniref:Pectinesterase inhibitor 10-like n=1 Tax=Spinacia oleracea TaxID=3562 RepID=A0ABM3QMQ7_SPIOL|nr:pectinesterase inhibitor 10-like [Spinacia oleracea]